MGSRLLTVLSGGHTNQYCSQIFSKTSTEIFSDDEIKFM